jgi:hypothetical protein
MNRHKYIAGAFAILAVAAVTAMAGMRTKTYQLEGVGLATNAVTYAVRGDVKAVRIDVDTATTRTNMVYLVDDYGQIIFSNATLIADATYYPRVQGQTVAGAALTWTELGTINSVPSTNAVTTTFFAEPFSVAGNLTATFVNQGVSTTQTNGADVIVIYAE